MIVWNDIHTYVVGLYVKNIQRILMQPLIWYYRRSILDDDFEAASIFVYN